MSCSIDRGTHGAKVVIAWDKLVGEIQGFPKDIAVERIVSVDLTRAMPLRLRALLRLPIPRARRQRADLTTKVAGTTRWEALLEQTGPLLSQLRNQLAAAGRAEEDLRPFVVGGLYALDLDKPDLARSFAAQAAKGRAKLLPWQRAMLDQRLLDRLGAIAEWRALLAR